MQLLVRNKVKEFDHWKNVFDANLEPPRAAGLTLCQMWRAIDDPNEVFFLFEVEDRGRAEAFIQAPKSATTGVEAGVIEGEAHFETRVFATRT
jgi:hypothetical protein